MSTLCALVPPPSFEHRGTGASVEYD